MKKTPGKRRLECVGRVLLVGVRDPGSPLSLLRGVARNLMPLIYARLQAMYEAHIEVDDNVVQGKGSRDASMTTVSAWNCGVFRAFPDHADPPINVNMMPCSMNRKSLTGLPNGGGDWADYLTKTRAFRFASTNESSDVVFLTIHESTVEAGQSQRRPGLHVEAPGTLVHPGSCVVYPQQIPSWGGRAPMTQWSEEMDGGLFMASNIDNSCQIWHCRILRPEQVVGEGGSIEHMRAALSRVARSSLMRAHEVWWITDATPHESLPLKKTTKRTFVRVVSPTVTAWYADHSTHNTKTPLPGDVTVVKGDKFAGPEETVSEPCGFCGTTMPKMYKCATCGKIYCNTAHLQNDMSCPSQQDKGVAK